MKKVITFFLIILILGIVLVFSYNKEEKEDFIVNPIVEEISSTTDKEVEQVTVEIKGEVNNPGVYKVENESRIIDLINIAGGLTSNAVTNNLNLAKKLKDEMVIYIYNKNDLVENIKTEYVYLECKCPEVKNDACIEDKNIENVEDSEKNELININTASKEMLITLSGIGEKTADKIIEYREKNPFNTIDDIKNVSGIGESLYEKIKDFITV